MSATIHRLRHSELVGLVWDIENKTRGAPDEELRHAPPLSLSG